MKISELQKLRSRRALYVPGFTRMIDVIGVLERSGYGAVIVAGEPDSLNGIITEGDVVRGLALHGSRLLEMKAQSVLVTARDVCSPEEYVTDVAKRMLQRGVEQIAVRSNGCLVDVIGLQEIVAAQQEDRRRATRSLAAFMGGTRLRAS